MKAPASYDKLRGGYYTPSPIADFLAHWAIRSGADRVLEPSCGDGAICLPALRRLAFLAGASPTGLGQIVAVELHAEEAQKVARALSGVGPSAPHVQLLVGDFFSHAARWTRGEPLFASDVSFDAVVGNPPFIRYQNFPEESRRVAFELVERVGLHPNGLTNAWVPFLVVSSMLLKDDGRLAMVIPAELLQVSYAAEIRRFLSDFFERITLVTFRKLLFAPAQQDVILLLAEKRAPKTTGIRVVELDSTASLGDHTASWDRRRPKRLDHSTEKWTRYFLSEPQLALIRQLEADERVTRVGACAQVDVGVVTGENGFFVLTEEDARRLSILEVAKPLVSRTAQVPGMTFHKKEWRQALAKQAPVLLFAPPDRDLSQLSKPVRSYIGEGERAGFHMGYKCSIRKRWYVVPSQWIPDAFALRQVHDYPRIVLNRAGATATDTLHRVRFTNGIRPEVLAAAFVNSLTLAFAEVTGRSYGGGVLTFEPSEMEKLPIPLGGALALDLECSDQLAREGRITELLDISDRALLANGLGLDKRDVKLLRGAWHTLRDRRNNRNRA